MDCVGRTVRPTLLPPFAPQPRTSLTPAPVLSSPRASMYRVTGDFHAEPAWVGARTSAGLAEHAFVSANLSKVQGVKNTWADLDMMDLGVDSPWHGTPTARLHATIWMMAKSPLMFAGQLPASAETLNLIANPLALDIHAHSSGMTASYQGDCSCKRAKQARHSLCRLALTRPCRQPPRKTPSGRATR